MFLDNLLLDCQVIFSIKVDALLFIDDNLLWNGKHISLRSESEHDPLGDLNDDIQHYNNLPFAIESKFPMRGTTRWGNNKNTLIVSEATNVYMLRSPKWGDWNKMMEIEGWEATGMTGEFVGESSLEIYKRFFKPGRYQMDATSALYLFEDGKLKQFDF